MSIPILPREIWLQIDECAEALLAMTCKAEAEGRRPRPSTTMHLVVRMALDGSAGLFRKYVTHGYMLKPEYESLFSEIYFACLRRHDCRFSAIFHLLTRQDIQFDMEHAREELKARPFRYSTDAHSHCNTAQLLTEKAVRTDDLPLFLHVKGHRWISTNFLVTNNARRIARWVASLHFPLSWSCEAMQYYRGIPLQDPDWRERRIVRELRDSGFVDDDVY
jgi:hypothetical protein